MILTIMDRAEKFMGAADITGTIWIGTETVEKFVNVEAIDVICVRSGLNARMQYTNWRGIGLGLGSCHPKSDELVPQDAIIRFYPGDLSIEGVDEDVFVPGTLEMR